MGTRHLICVKENGENKVAQYGQWDGYPSGQGIDILSFISIEGNLQKLKEKLSRVRFIDAKGKDKDFINSYQKNAPKWSRDPDNRTDEQKNWFKKFQSRDLSTEILINIVNSDDDEILLSDESNFLEDGLFCEYYYLIDFDDNKFFIYSSGKSNLIKKYDLNKLPTKEQFLKDCGEDNE